MCFPRQQAGKDSVYLQFKVRSRAAWLHTGNGVTESRVFSQGEACDCRHHSMTDCSCVLTRFWAAKPERMDTVKGEVLPKPAYDAVARVWAAGPELWRHTGLQTFGNVVLTFTLGFSVEAKQFSTCVPYKWANIRHLSLRDFFLICVYVFMYMHFRVYVYVHVCSHVRV